MLLLKERNCPANWAEDSFCFIRLGFPFQRNTGCLGTWRRKRGFKAKTEHSHKESDGKHLDSSWSSRAGCCVNYKGMTNFWLCSNLAQPASLQLFWHSLSGLGPTAPSWNSLLRRIITQVFCFVFHHTLFMCCRGGISSSLRAPYIIFSTLGMGNPWA